MPACKGRPLLKALQVSPEGECASAARVMKAANKGRSALSWASFLATQALAQAVSMHSAMHFLDISDDHNMPMQSCRLARTGAC